VPPRSHERPVVAVLLPMVWSVRNVVHAGVLDRLVASARVRLLIPGASRGGFDDNLQTLADEVQTAPLLDVSGRPVKGKALIDAVLTSGFWRRRGVGSHRVYQRWWLRHATRREQLRNRFIDGAGKVAGRSEELLTTLQAMSAMLYRRTHDLQPVRDQLSALRADALWSTVCVSPLEYPYLLAARQLGIPTIASILSFDNLTSRGALPTYDHYLVWSEAMKCELLRLYPRVPSTRVTVTGTPQFDFHRKAQCRWPRERTVAALKLPPNARYFVYAASHERLAPEEPTLVQSVAQVLKAHDELKDAWLIVRLHPLDDGRRWEKLRGLPRTRVERAWGTRPTGEGWTASTFDDQARLVSLLLHADACLNVASTMTLDAAIVDRPVICLELSDEPGAPREIMYSEYQADHYRPLVESGGLRLARSWAELADLMVDAIRVPDRNRSGRAAMVRSVCGEVDGRAAERVAAAILTALGARPVPAPPTGLPTSVGTLVEETTRFSAAPTPMPGSSPEGVP
jgi:hypothetical protein